MTAHGEMPEHEFEAAPGLPEALPPGERLLWQGAPDWRVLARDALHVRLIGGYFAVLVLWRTGVVLTDPAPVPQLALALLWPLPLAAVALGLLALLAWLIARTSLYTITDRRVVMRVGIVLSITFNLPFRQIDAARLHTHADGSGNLSLLLAGDGPDSARIAYLHLWPHARPWHLRRTEPMLRALPDARAVAGLLTTALAESAGVTRLPLPAQPAPPRSAGVVQQPLAA